MQVQILLLCKLQEDLAEKVLRESVPVFGTHVVAIVEMRCSEIDRRTMLCNVRATGFNLLGQKTALVSDASHCQRHFHLGIIRS